MIYCVSDIHGCYEEFRRLLDKIQFSDKDTLYILGDVIDRGDGVMECLDFIKSAKNIQCLLGNHEAEMLRYYAGEGEDWLYLGCGSSMSAGGGTASTVAVPGFQNLRFTDTGHWRHYVGWVRGWPAYAIVYAGNKSFFLSHAGLDPKRPIHKQRIDDLVWGRETFYKSAGLKKYVCVFGHTPTYYIRGNTDCSIWDDERHGDKICIDSGCVYGGALAALRLDDGAVFYAKALAKRDRRSPLHVERRRDKE